MRWLDLNLFLYPWAAPVDTHFLNRSGHITFSFPEILKDLFLAEFEWKMCPAFESSPIQV